MPSYEAVNWWGLVVPAGTLAPIIERLHKAVQEVQSSAEVQNAAGCDSYISKPQVRASCWRSLTRSPSLRAMTRKPSCLTS